MQSKQRNKDNKYNEAKIVFPANGAETTGHSHTKDEFYTVHTN